MHYIKCGCQATSYVIFSPSIQKLPPHFLKITLGHRSGRNKRVLPDPIIGGNSRQWLDGEDITFSSRLALFSPRLVKKSTMKKT